MTASLQAFWQSHVQLLYVLGGVAVLLAVATLAIRYTGRRGTELHQRIQSWWLIVVLFTVAILLPERGTLVFFGLLSFLALKEYFSIIPTRRADRRVLLWAYLAIPVQMIWIAIPWYNMFLIFIPVYMFLLIPTSMVLVGQTDGFLRAAGTINWGLMTCVFSLSHMAYLLVIPDGINPNSGGAGLLLYLVLLTQLNDVNQYIWGKTFGRRKIIPSVSPGKTVNGFLGGLVTTAILAIILAPLLTPFTTGFALAAGVIIGVFGFIGDVTISAVKRDLNIKDSGSMLPGHGGILDRVDSLTYTAPLFFHFVKYFFIG